MKTSSKYIVTLLLGGSIAGAAFASQDEDSDKDEYRNMGQVTVSMEEAVQIARDQVPGKVISAELEDEDGKMIWEVEMLAKNRQRHELEIDAATGKLTKQEQEHDEGSDRERED